MHFSFLTVCLAFVTAYFDVENNVICPPHYTYLVSGNECLFFLDGCKNFSEAKETCSTKLGHPIGLINSKEHFNDLCQFASKRLPSESSFYLDAYKKNGLKQEQFLWKLDKTNVLFTEHFTKTGDDHECLEMTVSKDGCRLRDSPCHELKRPLCEFVNVNPCLFDDGGCDGTCIPRHRGERKCTCPTGQISIGSQCYHTDDGVEFTCPLNSFYVEETNMCFGKTERVFQISDPHTESECSDVIGSVAVGPATLRDELVMDNQCESLRKLLKDTPNWRQQTFAIKGFYDKSSKNEFWDKLGSSVRKSRLCRTNHDNAQNDPYLNCVILIVSKSKCCIEVVTCDFHTNVLCEIPPPNECRIWPVFGNCPKGLVCTPKPGYREFDCNCQLGLNKSESGLECENMCSRDNGGCHHICRDTEEGRECSCREGYEVYMETECRYKDRCMANSGEAGCPLYIGKRCDDKDDPPSRDTATDNTYLKVILIFLLVLIAGIGISAFARTMRSFWENTRQEQSVFSLKWRESVKNQVTSNTAIEPETPIYFGQLDTADAFSEDEDAV